MAHRLTEFVARLVRREDLGREEAEQLLEALLDAEATEAQIAAALVALAAKGETVEELAGARRGTSLARSDGGISRGMHQQKCWQLSAL